MKKNAQDFLNTQFTEISQVYSGKRDCCRCGCGGEYTATSAMTSPRSRVDDQLVRMRLNRAKRLIREGAEFLSGDTFFDVKTSNTRTLTFYFDELN